MTRREWIGLVAATAIIGLYMGARAYVYREVPLDEYSWEFRDTLMNGPRLVGFFLALGIGWRLWGRRYLGFHFRGGSEAVWIGFLAIIVFHAAFELRPERIDYAGGAILLLTVSSLIVALFEETLFRGLLYRALAGADARVGLWGSAFLFTIYHWQAQPLTGWPTIFLWGIFYGLMVSRGIGLGWTIAIHALFDATIFLGTQGASPPLWLAMMSFGAELIFVTGYALREVSFTSDRNPAASN